MKMMPRMMSVPTTWRTAMTQTPHSPLSLPRERTVRYSSVGVLEPLLCSSQSPEVSVSTPRITGLGTAATYLIFIHLYVHWFNHA